MFSSFAKRSRRERRERDIHTCRRRELRKHFDGSDVRTSGKCCKSVEKRLENSVNSQNVTSGDRNEGETGKRAPAINSCRKTTKRKMQEANLKLKRSLERKGIDFVYFFRNSVEEIAAGKLIS